MEQKVTFRLTEGQFRTLLTVVLADDAPDDLTSLVLMACTRPHQGIIGVPIPAADAATLCALVRQASDQDPDLMPLITLLEAQSS
jgi:hypothetical protein